MKKILVLLLTVAFVFGVVGTATATLIYSEGFNTDGNGTRYTVAGGGVDSTEVWGLASTETSGALSAITGKEGADFFAGRDLNDSDLPPGFSSDNPRTLTLNNVDISGFNNVTVTIALAASQDVFETPPDLFRIIAINNDTMVATILDNFLADSDKSLVGSESGTTLTTAFQDVVYENSFAGITNLGLRVEAWSTYNDELYGIDNIRIEGTSVPVPEPATLLLLGTGLIGLAGFNRKFRK